MAQKFHVTPTETLTMARLSFLHFFLLLQVAR
jgi:hypothetical protein